MTLSLLIAEDAPDIADIVSFSARMTWPGCKVTVAENGTEALERFASETPDLVILDIGLPPPDGIAVCRRIREESSVPILMLTARNQTIDKVRAFDVGADDYLTKPFDPVELVARMRALIRRTAGPTLASQSGFVLGDLSIDYTTHEVRIAERLIRLTSTEYRLLEELARNAGHTLPHHVLLDRVWGSEWDGDPNYIKVFVRRLRQKLGDDAEHPRYIETDWGLGYRMLSSR